MPVIINNDPPESGPCVKRPVKATVIALDGTRYEGTNYCMTPQKVCPRQDMPTGVGYELCASVCDQKGHAEVNALQYAGKDAFCATMFVEGHTYACNPCLEAANKVGVAYVIIGAPPEDFKQPLWRVHTLDLPWWKKFFGFGGYGVVYFWNDGIIAEYRHSDGKPVRFSTQSKAQKVANYLNASPEQRAAYDYADDWQGWYP